MRKLKPRLIELMTAIREAYPHLTRDVVQQELNRVETMICGASPSRLLEIYEENEVSGRNNDLTPKEGDSGFHIRHRLEEEILRMLIAITGADMSEEQEEGLLRLLEEMHKFSLEHKREPKVPGFMLLTLMSLIHRVLAKVESE